MDVIADGIWSARVADFSMMGLRIGTRMTIVRLDDRSLLVHSPIPLRDPLKAEVDSLGDVRALVCPNLYHHLFADVWAKACPNARLYGPAKLHAKRKDLTFHGTLDTTFPGLEPIAIDGCMLEETVFVHPKTRTLVTSDLAENFPRMDHFLTRQWLRLNGTLGTVGWPRVLRFLYRDKKRARASIDRVLEHDIDRLILAHGDIVESGAKDAISRTFAFLE